MTKKIDYEWIRLMVDTFYKNFIIQAVREVYGLSEKKAAREVFRATQTKPISNSSGGGVMC